MWGNNMVVDLSLITLDNLTEYQLLFRKKRKPRGLNAKGKESFKKYRCWDWGLFLDCEVIRKHLR